MKSDRRKIYEVDEYNRATLKATSEEAIKKQEAAAQPKDGDRDMTKVDGQMGRAMRVSHVIKYLLDLNRALIFEVSKGDPTKYGIYIPCADKKGPVQEIMFVTGMESGLNLGGRINEGRMPEFTIMVTETEIVPDGDSVKKSQKFVKQIKGWRSVVAALIKAGLITEAAANKKFGIAQGRDSANWQKAVSQ